MKTIYTIILFTIIASLTSYSAFAQGSKGHGKTPAVSKQRMKMDAYALANIKCEYKLNHMNFTANGNDPMLIAKVEKLRTDEATFLQYAINRYNGSEALLRKFNKKVESAAAKLSTCKQLKALEEKIAKESIEVPDDDQSKPNDKK
ncbi:MAG: hypothetical protein H8E34_03960 [Bacteroidetes bacterium]|nr:hypothetical protein [Bacteroidota bacterium]MBL6943191.1 hypothetical protein [Bacteroidales bacterium]